MVSRTDVRETYRAGAAVRVTVETALDSATAESFYSLYLDAFEALRRRAVARQVLHRHEFFEEMQDERVWKYVAWDPEGRPCGLTVLTRHLETVPWISPEYFAAHYPEHYARGAVYYLGFTLVAMESRRERVFKAMVRAVVDRVAADRGVCGYDICAYNNIALDFAGTVEQMLVRGADARVEPLDTQTYYCADLSASRRPADGRVWGVA